MTEYNLMERKTLCFLVDTNRSRILLKAGFKDQPNANYSGYVGNVNSGETPENAAVRELREKSSLSVSPSDLEQKAVLDIFSSDIEGLHQRTHVYFASNWTGNPKRINGTVPEWFPIGDIPYMQMNDIAKLWLPPVLRGEKVSGTFYLKDDSGTLGPHFIRLIKD